MYPYYPYGMGGYPRPQGQGIEPPRNHQQRSAFPKKGARKLDLHTAVTSTQNIISTLSEAIPLYTQMKPMIESGGKIFRAVGDSVKKKFFSPASAKTSTKQVIEPEIVTPKQETKKETPKETTEPEWKEQTTPSSPLFYS